MKLIRKLKKRRIKMKYLLRNGKVEYSGNKKQLIDYVKNKYKDDLWVRQNLKNYLTISNAL